MGNAADVTVQGFASGSNTPISLGTYTKAQQNSYQNMVISSTTVIASIKLSSTGQFTINDFGVSYQECFEYVIADLGTSKPVGSVVIKAPTDANAGFSVLVSNAYPYTWQSVFGPITLDYAVHTFTFTQTNARYVMLKVANPTNYRQMNVFEAHIYDMYHIYGAPYAANRANTRSYSDLLGVNGIWGWGTGDEPAKLNTTGPRLFIPVASHARNYHNLNWDLVHPTDVVYYNGTNGTPAQNWLDWNMVYGNWRDAGFKIIDASIQFGNDSFPQYVWPDPYNNAYTYGKNFASNFGPSHKKLIDCVEVGNEPWSYNADFYVKVLEGMVKGFRDGDPKIMISPGAFQADTRDVPPQGDGISYNNKYAGFRISATALASINVLNSHCYSYAIVNNKYIGVPPEYSTTNFKAFRNMMRWRDANTPSSEVWLTEWGWDGSSNCVESRCVSLNAEAAYGVRGLLIGAREGLNRMTWFNFADGGDGTIVYDNSGLVTGSNAKKPAYYAFVNFLSVLSGYHHVAALKEADDAYIYVVTNGANYKIVAWRPAFDADLTTESSSTFTLSGYTLSGTSFVEITAATSGTTTLPTSTFSQSGSTLTMKLSGYPRVMNVAAASTATSSSPTSSSPTSSSPTSSSPTSSSHTSSSAHTTSPTSSSPTSSSPTSSSPSSSGPSTDSATSTPSTSPSSSSPSSTSPSSSSPTPNPSEQNGASSVFGTFFSLQFLAVLYLYLLF